jgi:hypothetical protein
LEIETTAMADQNDLRWQEFDSLGQVEVRKRVTAKIWTEEKAKLAHQWLAYQESQESSASRQKTLDVTKEAADLAKSAMEAARTSTMIATLALIAAAIAVVLSVIGLFLKS